MRLDIEQIDVFNTLPVDKITELCALTNVEMTERLLTYPYFQKLIATSINENFQLDADDKQNLNEVAAHFASLDSTKRQSVLNAVAMMQCQQSILTSTDPEFLKSLAAFVDLPDIIGVLRETEFKPVGLLKVSSVVTRETILAVSALMGRLILGQLPPSYVKRYRLLDNAVVDEPLALPPADKNWKALEVLYRHAVSLHEKAGVEASASPTTTHSEGEQQGPNSNQSVDQNQ